MHILGYSAESLQIEKTKQLEKELEAQTKITSLKLQEIKKS